jgi:outer membrane protein assembly factor BamB
MSTELMGRTESQHQKGGLAWIHRHPRLHRNLNRAVFGMFIVFAVGQIYMRFFSDQPWGPSIPNLVTESMIVLSVMVGLGWLIVCSRLDRRVVWGIAIPAVVAIVGLAASIRRIHFDGHMAMSFEWKWQRTNDEVLREWQSQAPKAQSFAAPVPAEISIDDMPGYRGANRDGVVVGPPVNEDWTAHPPRIVWKHPVGGGYSQFAVVGGALVTLEQRGDQEAVVCYDAETGNELWQRAWPARFDEAMGGPGPRSTPTIADGRVYALGAVGHLECLDLADGKSIWSHELLKELQLGNSMWAMTSSPLVVDDRLIVNIGGWYGGGLIALDRQTGDVVWKSEAISATKETPPQLVAAALQKLDELPPPVDGEHAAAANSSERNFAGYASPMLVTIDGVKQILNFDGMGLWGHALDDGRPLWFNYFSNGPGVNSAQPVLLPEGRILISASYDVGSRLLRVARNGDEWQVEALWGGEKKTNRQLRSKMSTPVFVDGYIYGLDEGILVCIDPADGKRLWKGSREVPSRGRYNHGQLLVTNGLIVLLSEQGDLVLIRPQPDKLVELGTLHVLDGEKTWNPPALVRGKLFVRNHHEMACVDVCSVSTSETETRSETATP